MKQHQIGRLIDHAHLPAKRSAPSVVIDIP